MLLFLINLIGGYYCAREMNICNDALTRLILCVFVGWVFIAIYIYNYFRDSSGSSNNYGRSSSSYSSTNNGTISNSVKDSYTNNTPNYRSETNQDIEKQINQQKDCDFYTKVAGVTFENRQQYVRQCKDGQSLDLIRDKFNPYDKNAIAVYAGNNQVGFISQDIAKELAPKMDNGKKYDCSVQSVTGGSEKIYGLNIKVTELVGVLGSQEKVIKDSKWEYEKGSFQQEIPNMAASETVGRTFYTSNYQCPECGKFMLKANAGEYIEVLTPHGNQKLKSVFACTNCERIYSAVAGHPLSDGEYYVMKDKNNFENVMDNIDTYGVSRQKLKDIYGF